LLEDESTPGPQRGRNDYVSLKKSGIEPATFRLVAQYLNKLRRRLTPHSSNKKSKYIKLLNLK
jgi:hypothetical protein